jgi:hypothetical protein
MLGYRYFYIGESAFLHSFIGAYYCSLFGFGLDFCFSLSPRTVQVGFLLDFLCLLDGVVVKPGELTTPRELQPHHDTWLQLRHHDSSASTGVAASISDTRPDAAMFLPTQHVSSHVTVKVPDFWMKDPLF